MLYAQAVKWCSKRNYRERDAKIRNLWFLVNVLDIRRVVTHSYRANLAWNNICPAGRRQGWYTYLKWAAPIPTPNRWSHLS